VAYVLALVSAALYGAADFIGGLASRRAATVLVVIVTQAAGLILLAILLPLLPDASASRPDLLWGVAAGLSGSAGVALLYRALAIGTMAIVAPTTAVCAVAIPVLAGVALGERPPAITVAGIALALVAIVLVSQQGSNGPSRAAGVRGALLPPGLGLALLSGVAIGLFFLSLARTGAGAGLWPLLVARSVSLLLFGAIAAAQRTPLRMAPAVLGIAIAGGVLDMGANALYLVAVRGGPLTAVVTLSSLYPASTVVLAAVILRERLNRAQIAGIACALAAVLLIVSPGR
jgi:drug/metabolite transporter (DMT)-like permease